MTAPERTADGRYVVVGGRRWRASDPSLPEELRQALVDELMAARRAVGAAGDDADAERAARARVQDAKVALGERGTAWWQAPGDGDVDGRRDAAVRALSRSWDEPATTDRVIAAAAEVVARWPAVED